MHCGKGGFTAGAGGRAFVAGEASREDEARGGEEPCVGPGFVFTVGGTRLEREKLGRMMT